MTTPMRKLLVGAGLTVATLTGGAIGASFVGTASAQTTDTTTPAVTDTPAPAAGTANPDKANCPHDGSGSDSSSSSSSTETPAT